MERRPMALRARVSDHGLGGDPSEEICSNHIKPFNRFAPFK
jgi:hypothetical protein